MSEREYRWPADTKEPKVPPEPGRLNPADVEMLRLWLGIGLEHRIAYIELGERFGCSPSWACKRVKRTMRLIVSNYLAQLD